MPTVASAVVSLLSRAGIRRCYTVPGESYLELLDEIERAEGMRLISTRHESGAAFMAEADARMSGVPGVAMASRGPGATNLSIGVQTAHYDGTPLVAILGQVESGVLGRGALQEIDLAALYAPITKWSVQAEAAGEVPALIARGLELAAAGRPGPVAIAVPADFWAAAYPGHVGDSPATPGTTGQAHARDDQAHARDDTVAADMGADIADRLTAAANPVAVVGGGAVRVRAAVVDFAERFGVGVYTAFRRQDAFPADHPQYLGHLGLGMPNELLAAMEKADLLLLIGARLDEVTSQSYRYPRPSCEMIHIGQDAARAAPRPAAELAATLRGIQGAASRDWSAAHQAATEAAAVPLAPAVGVHPAHAVAAFQRGLPADTIVTNDAGNFAAFLHRHWRFTGSATQLGPANGGMGYGVPAAIGAKLAEPGRTVLAVVGDGGVLMTGQEIETAVRCGVKIIVLVLQNGMYGTIAMHQAKRMGNTAGAGIGMVDLPTWAIGLGATGLWVTETEQLDGAVAAALEASGPVVVTVRTDPDIISPGARLSELLRKEIG